MIRRADECKAEYREHMRDGDGTVMLTSFISGPEELNEDMILPAAFDPRVGKAVAEAVAKAARDEGVARI